MIRVLAPIERPQQPINRVELGGGGSGSSVLFQKTVPASSSSSTATTAATDTSDTTASYDQPVYNSIYQQAQANKMIQAMGTKKAASKGSAGIIGCLLFAATLIAQTDNTFYVRQFPGTTVGQKVSNAMAVCGSDTAVPCILVLDPSLAKWPAGTMPTLCAQCSLADYRAGGPLTNGGTASFLFTNGVANANSFPGADIGAKINAAEIACGAALSGYNQCTIDVPPNTIASYSTTITLFPYVDLRLNGSHLTYMGSADAVSVPKGSSDPFPYITGSIQNGRLTGTPAAANGVHQVDRIGFLYDRLAIDGFTGAGASAIFLENKTAWNEETRFIAVKPENNSVGIKMLVNGGTNSFGYTLMRDVHFGLMDGQVGLLVQSSAGYYGGASLYNSDLEFMANANSTTTSPTLIKLVSAEILRSHLVSTFEATSGSLVAVDTSSNGYVYASGYMSVGGSLAGPANTFVLTPTINQMSGTIRSTPENGTIAPRRPIFDFGPSNTDVWLASYGGGEVDGHFQVSGRNTTTTTGDTDANGGSGASVQSIFYADGKSKSVGIGPGFSDSSLPTAVLDVNGTALITGNVQVGNGSNIVYRCTTAGTLPVGALTITAGNCGASSDTGLRVK